MSCYPLGLLKRAIERCNLDVVISYAHFSLQNTRLLTDLLPVAEAQGVGMLNASPLSLGLFTNQGPPPWHPAPGAIRDACRRAAELCRSRGADIAFLGMQFCFAEKRIPEHHYRHREEAGVGGESPRPDRADRPALLTDVQAILAPVKDQSWPSGNWKE